jgi:hypothetical protein
MSPYPVPVTRRPLLLTVAAGLTGLEALGLVVMAVLGLTKVSTMSTTSSGFFLVFAAALVVCGVALVRLNSWARAPIVLTQLIALGLAWDARDNLAVAIPLAVAAVVTLSTILAPSSLEALARE